MFKKILMLMILSSSVVQSTWATITNHAYPGGVASIPIQAQGRLQPKVTFQGHQVLTVKQNNNWVAYVGIPLEQEVGQSQIEVAFPGRAPKSIKFEVNSKTYPVDELTIKNKRKVSPLPEDLTRIKKESELLEQAFTHWREAPIHEFSMIQPVEGRISGIFGLKRILNKIPSSAHKGVDIAADKGTPVKAVKDGVVTLTGDFFLPGNTVVLDHGQGWQTVYCHLDNIKVKKGMKVKEKDIIGTVGQTGRATGPHLHFGMILNEARVDPSLFWNLNN